MKTEFETLFIQKAIEAYHTEHRNLIESTKRQFAGMFGIIPNTIEEQILRNRSLLGVDASDPKVIESNRQGEM
jgi:hypothetical protein